MIAGIDRGGRAVFYVAAKVLSLVFTPSNFISLLIVGGALLQAIGRGQRLGRNMVLAGALLLAVLGFSPLGAWLSIPLEERFPRPLPPDDVAGIILLGGYEDTPIAIARRTVTVNEAADRLLETALLAKRFPKAKVIITGGWATILPNTLDSTAPVAEFLASMAIDQGRILAEKTSRNTHENALFTQQLVRPAGNEKYLLVTSAYHMPRAVGAFRAQSFDIIAWPVDYRTTGWSDAAKAFRWAIQGLERVDLASKEWVGLFMYWLTGRTKVLFPSP